MRAAVLRQRDESGLGWSMVHVRGRGRLDWGDLREIVDFDRVCAIALRLGFDDAFHLVHEVLPY
jgi:hypothetical protein